MRILHLNLGHYPDAKRLRELEAENRKLKLLLGEAQLDKAALKELLANW